MPRAAALVLLLLTGCGGVREALVARDLARRRAEAGLAPREAVVDGRPVAYLERLGAGPPVVLLHGFGASKDVWLWFAAAYPEGRRLLAPDLAGHGGSAHDSAAVYDTARLAAEVGAFLDAVAPGPVDAVGNSLGGAVAAHLALAGRARRLVVLAGAGVRGPTPTRLDSLVHLGELPLVPTSRPEVDRLLELAFVGDPDIPGLARDVLAADYARRAPFLRALFARIAAERDALRPQLGRIEAPALVLWGEADAVLSPSSAPLWGTGLPRATVIVMPGVGHAPHQERPARTAQLVARFLAPPGE